MGFLRKLLFGKAAGSHPEPPQWAGFMSREKFARFKIQAEAGILRLNPAAVIDWEQCIWKSAPEDGMICGLTNLAQICNAVEEHLWQSEIMKFASLPASKAPELKNMAYEEVKTKLKVRLYPLDMTAPFIVTAPYCDSFHSALVVDFPDHISLVSNECVETWGVPVHELFKVGLENVYSENVPTISMLPEGSESPIILFESDSFFTATHALMLDKHLVFDEELGLLVIIPNRHVSACIKVADQTADSTKLLASLAKKFYKNGPGSVTPDVLWFRSGQFQKVIVKGNKIIVP